MEKKTVISVIVPVYNVENYLKKCINSIINQTFKNLEIILVDDGSSDRSGDICDEYCKLDKRIKVIHKKNGGLSSARNIGIDNATGTYISFIDSDDWIEENLYEHCISLFREKVDIINFGIQRNYSDGSFSDKKSDEYKLLNNKEAVISLNTFRNVDVSSCNKIYRRSLFNKIRFPEGKLCEDCYIMYKIFLKANRIVITPFIGYHYFKRIGSITQNKNVNMDFIYAHYEQMIYLDKNYPDLAVIGESSYAFSNLTVYNTIIAKNIKNKKMIKEIRKNSRKYSRKVYFNPYLNTNKKIQFFVYDYFIYIYKFIYTLKTKIVK